MNFRTRIVRVRPKRGQKIELLRVLTAPDQRRQHIEEDLQVVLNNCPGDIAGWAVLVWDTEMIASGHVNVWKNPIPSVLVPDFVRNWLLANRAELWAIESIKREGLV